MDLSFTIATGHRKRSHAKVCVPRDSWPHFTISDSRLQALDYLFVAAYDSQGYGWAIRPRLHTSRVESCVRTDGQSASLSWNKASIWGLRPDLYFCQTVAGLLMWGTLSDERTDLSFTIAADLASAVILGSEFRGTRDHILLSQIRDFHFAASYDSQGYGGGIRHRLHTGYSWRHMEVVLLMTSCHGPRRKHRSQQFLYCMRMR
jgi:hypothetical protein